MICPMCLGKGYATDEDIKEYPHRCQNCDGKGFYCIDWQKVRCEVCNGSGKKPQTNEEWLKQCNTEQLAEWIVGVVFDTEFKKHISKMGYINMHSYKTEVVEWLKQSHTNS